MKKKKIVSILLAAAIITQLSSGITGTINAETCSQTLKKDLILNSQTRSEMQDVKENAEKLLGEEVVNDTDENILVYDEDGHILNEVHTDGTVIEYKWDGDQLSSLANSDGFKCTYDEQKNGDIIEHSYFNNEKICDKELLNQNILEGSESQNISVEQKLKDYDSQVKLMSCTASNYYVNGRRMNSIMSNEDLLTQSMTESQIQSFLKSKGSILKNTISIYRKNSSGKVYDTGRDVKPSKVIYNAAKDHGINPKVLLVTMQREQGLVTSSDASLKSRAVYFAMGYGATDNGDNVKYTGFDTQVEGAATTLKKLWIEAPSSATLPVNRGAYTRDGITYPGEIVVDTFSAYALYIYTPWVFDTSIPGRFGGGLYLFIDIYNGWWSTWS